METTKFEIETSFIGSLRNAGIELSKDAVCSITENSIVLGIYDINKPCNIAFGSTIELYAEVVRRLGLGRKNEIAFGSSGSFDPTVRESYWRTIHAASILKNWEIVSAIVNTHCKMYSDYIG